MPEGHRQFQFGPCDQRGLLAGLRSGQLVVIALALLGAVVLLHVVVGPTRIGLALLVVVAGITVATWPVRGRSIEEWVPVAARFALRSVVGTNREAVGGDRYGHPARPPAALARLEVVGGPNGGRVGVVRDHGRQTLTAVLELGGESFALLGEGERLRRFDGWSGVLASFARDAGSVHRIQWIERTLPDPNDVLRAHLAAVATDDPFSVVARASYRDLIELEGASPLTHELFLALTVGDRALPTVRRWSPHARGDGPDQLGGEVALLEERCRHAGLEVRGVLSPAGLRAMLRRGFDVVPIAAPPVWPWPVAYEASWASSRTDGLWHASFWVAEWPRHEVGSDFLLPLLVTPGIRRTVSVVMAPVAPLRAVRHVEQARTAGVADAELRRRHGFVLTARSRREQDAVVRREVELASGHGAFHFSGYVTVSAPGHDALEGACRELVHAAALSGLDLRRLYGTQAEALICTLPLGRGSA